MCSPGKFLPRPLFPRCAWPHLGSMRDGGTPSGFHAVPPSLPQTLRPLDFARGFQQAQGNPSTTLRMKKKSPGGFHLRAIRLKVFLERLSCGDGGEDKGHQHPVPSARSWRVQLPYLSTVDVVRPNIDRVNSISIECFSIFYTHLHVGRFDQQI
jgi:hypothetical protein